jgi:hypothetical protein
MKIDILE